MDRRILRQNDREWRADHLGEGVASIGRYGCLLVVLTQALIELGLEPQANPKDINARLKKARAFAPSSSSLVLPHAAAALGLTSPLDARVDSADPAALVPAIETTLATGGLAVLHVDHDAARKGGDGAPDHFTLATALKAQPDGTVKLANLDPATGREELLDWPALTGTVRWSDLDERRYRVLSVRPLHRAGL
jgi:hypothetical protein